MGCPSTSLQLLKVLENWTKVIDDVGILHAVYMGFMRAFDKVPLNRQLHKVRHYGISDRTCTWIKNFLNNRQQCVQVNGSKSHWKSVTSGIQQGSVLDPILFVIFINDLPRDVLSDVFMFADDTKIFRQISEQTDREIIQSDLDKLFDWSQTWLLKFHPDKCLTSVE